ncbi:MAG: WG repeat-containing protein [Prolixibacteraceae bacterium]|nr:WG repeat-containing protein [Prolixibacteraceae bacterium]
MHNVLIPYRAGNKWGYCDSTKNVIIECKFDDALPFHNGFAKVKIERAWGLINEFGKKILEPWYEKPNDIDILSSECIIARSSIYDKTGHEIERSIEHFERHDQYLIVSKNYSKFNKHGICKYSTKYGVITHLGKFLIKIEYNYISACYAIQWNNKDKELFGFHVRRTKDGFIDKLGRTLIHCDYNNLGCNKFSDFLIFSLDGKMGVYDIEGNNLLPPKYDSLIRLKEDIFSYGIDQFQNTVYGFINKDFELEIPQLFDWATDFSNGLSIVLKKGRCGVINEKGKLIIPLIYLDIVTLNAQTLRVKSSNHKVGLLSNNGSILLRANYSKIEEFKYSNRYYLVCQYSWRGEEIGLFDIESKKILIKCENIGIELLEENIWRIQKRFFYSKNGHPVPENPKLKSGKRANEVFKTWSKHWLSEPDYSYGYEYEDDDYGYSNYGSSSSDEWGDMEPEPDTPNIYEEFWDYIGVNFKEKYCIYNSIKNIRTKFLYDDIKTISPGFLVYRIEELWGVANCECEECTRPIYNAIEYIATDIYKVKEGSFWKLYSPSSYLDSKEEYDGIDLCGNAVVVTTSNKYGLFTFSGQKIFSPIFDKVFPTIFSDFFIVMIGNLYGIVTLSGKFQTECRYNKIYPFQSNKTIFLRNSNIYGILTIDGVEECILDFEKISFLDPNIIIVQKNNLYGIGNLNGEILSGIKYSEIKNIEDDYIHVSLNRKQGIISKKGEEIIPCKYDFIILLNHSRAIVRYDYIPGHYILYDLDNKRELLKTSCRYIDRITDTLYRGRDGSDYCLFDINGNSILPPVYDEIKLEKHGLIKINKEKNYGLIDNSGKFIIDFGPHDIEVLDDCIKVDNQYKDIYGNNISREVTQVPKFLEFNNTFLRLSKIYSFVHNLARFEVSKSDSRAFGVIKSSGEKIGPGTLLGVENSHGLIFCSNIEGFHLMNDEGDLILLKGVEDVEKIFDTKDLILVKIAGKYGVWDKRFNEIVPPEFDYHIFVQDDFIIVKKNEKRGVYGLDRRLILSCEYDLIRIINDETIMASKDNKYTVYDKNGSMLIDLQAENIKSLGENLFSVCINSKWGLFNRFGEGYTPVHFDSIKYLSDRILAVKRGKLWGLIDHWGKTVFPCSFEEISECNFETSHPTFFISKLNNKYGLINDSGGIILNPEFEKFDHPRGGFMVIQKNYKCGLINSKGEITIECEYDKLELISESNKIFKGRVNRLEGIMDFSGNHITEIKFTEIRPSISNLLFVKGNDGQTGYIDFNGNEYWE